jgi:hypothetical protein
MTSPTPRNFSNVTTAGSLTTLATPTDVALLVTGFANYPTVPFTATIDRNTASEEIVLVTAVNGGGTSLTVTRGYDGTAATTHQAGGPVEHTAVARDFREANQHTTATTNVHGTTGALVGSSGAQTITDKEMVGSLNTADASLGDAVVAWVPPDAPTRNLFRGMNTNGDDVAIVDASGNATYTKVSATSAPTSAAHLTRKDYVDSAVSAGTGAVGTSAPTANTVVKRDASGRAQVAAPSATADIATKGYADTAASSAVSGITNVADLSASTANNTASTLVKRDASARAKFADPSAAQDAATKNYVDNQFATVSLTTLTINGLPGTFSNSSASPAGFRKMVTKQIVAEGAVDVANLSASGWGRPFAHFRPVRGRV